MEKSRKMLLALVVVVVILVVLYFAYEKCLLNMLLPAKWQKSGCDNGSGSEGDEESFRGAYGRSPAMQTCLIGNDPKNPFNACMWV